MPQVPIPAVPGWVMEDGSSSGTQAGPGTGQQIKWLGQTLINKVTGNIANQQIGTYALPVQAAGGTYTTTVTNSMITATSKILLQVVNKPAAGGAGDVTAARMVHAWIEGDPTAGSVTVAYNTAVAMSQAWSVHVFIIN